MIKKIYEKITIIKSILQKLKYVIIENPEYKHNLVIDESKKINDAILDLYEYCQRNIESAKLKDTKKLKTLRFSVWNENDFNNSFQHEIVINSGRIKKHEYQISNISKIINEFEEKVERYWE